MTRTNGARQVRYTRRVAAKRAIPIRYFPFSSWPMFSQGLRGPSQSPRHFRRRFTVLWAQEKPLSNHPRETRADRTEQRD